MSNQETKYGAEVFVCADTFNGCRLIEANDIKEREEVEFCDTEEDARLILETMGEGEQIMRVPFHVAEMIEAEYGLSQ